MMRRLLALLVLALVALVGAQPTFADGTPVLSLPSAITVNVDNATSATVSYSAGAVDGLGSPLPVSCSPSSGSSFPLGTTTVGCSATDPVDSITTTGSFSVTVQDTTFPVLSLPTVAPVSVNGAASATVAYSASAADGGSAIPVSCAPASGAAFPLGTTHVACSATDGAGNTSNGSFDVTVSDTTPPTLSLPSNLTQSVNGSATKVVTYSASASDGGTPLAPTCAPSSGSAFPLGTTTVGCNVADAAGNPASGSFTVTVSDTTPPSVSVSGGPSGTVNVRTASISFSANEGTTSCSLDGGGFSGCGSPASYSGLADGGHTFTVRAVDAASNSSTASRSWSVDATPPALSLPNAAINIEADGASGGTATYNVTAADASGPLPPSATSCSPASSSLFPLGDTTVECKSTDPAGNTARGSFHVVVRDTTPPAINAPDVSVTATGADGIHRTDAALASYLSHVTATDLVSAATVQSNVPDVLPVGQRTVTFTAKDAAGNTATKRAVITVLPVGTEAPPVDLKPPANPSGITAKPGDGRVDLAWRSAADVAYVTVVVYAPGTGGAGKVAYRGSTGATSVKGLRNGAAYRFVLTAWDKAGNRSKGAVVRATPKVDLLRGPGDGARVSSPPLLRWAPGSEASYYNVQLWRGKQKVLSIWPAGARLQLRSSWTYEKKKHTLEPGKYTWYVWPGLGARAAARYGGLLGSRTFVVAKKKPAV